jgi:nucleoid DNA-binding protein
MAANTKKPPTKSEIYAKIVDDTGLTRKDVAAVFESLNGQIKKYVHRSRTFENARRQEAGSQSP